MKEEKIYLYTFKDNDSNDCYHILTKRNCTNLIESIENFYYDFENFENIESLIKFLVEENADKEFIEYMLKQREIEDLTNIGIYYFTLRILDDLDILLSFEEKVFFY